MQPSEDERILAALAHASIIANIVNLAGMFAAGLIWATQRERSDYVRRHALQSLLYQGTALLIMIFLLIFWGICLGLSLLPVAVRPDLYRSSPPNSFWIALLGLVLPVGFGVLATLYGLYGAYQAYQGRPFRYPLVGRVARRAAGAPRPADAPAAAPAPPAEKPATATEPAAPAPDEPALAAPELPPPAAPAEPAQPEDEE
jgi:uncharacterized Tic20 family protein